MRGVFSRSTRVAAAWLLIVVVLLAPSALASDTATDAGLWDAFVAWLAGRIDVPGGLTEPDEIGFTTWLMSRLVVPGG